MDMQTERDAEFDAWLKQPGHPYSLLYGANALKNQAMAWHGWKAARGSNTYTRALAAQPAEPVAQDLSELWVVWGPVEKDGKRYPEHCAGWKEACHEHINDAINEHDLAEARQWIVRQHPVAAPPQASTNMGGSDARIAQIDEIRGPGMSSPSPSRPSTQVQALVAEQAEDEGLWFEAQTASEAYLQQELRKLHALVEKAAAWKDMEKRRATPPSSQNAAQPCIGDPSNPASCYNVRCQIGKACVRATPSVEDERLRDALMLLSSIVACYDLDKPIYHEIEAAKKMLARAALKGAK